MAGEWINNIEVTHALKEFAISEYTLDQKGDGSLQMRVSKSHSPLQTIRSAMLELFGPGQNLELELVEQFDGKTVQYTSDLQKSR